MPQKKNKIEQLYSEHHSPLQRYVANKLPCAQEAEDVVQETFLRLATKNSSTAAAFARAQSPVAYLYRMACNLAVDKLRKRRPTLPFDPKDDSDHISTDENDLTDQLIRQRRKAQLEAAIQRLPSKRRQVLVLHKIRQLTYREVAAHMNISLGMVEKHMSLALAQLDRELNAGAADES